MYSGKRLLSDAHPGKHKSSDSPLWQALTVSTPSSVINEQERGSPVEEKKPEQGSPLTSDLAYNQGVRVSGPGGWG